MIRSCIDALTSVLLLLHHLIAPTTAAPVAVGATAVPPLVLPPRRFPAGIERIITITILIIHLPFPRPVLLQQHHHLLFPHLQSHLRLQQSLTLADPTVQADRLLRRRGRSGGWALSGYGGRHEGEVVTLLRADVERMCLWVCEGGLFFFIGFSKGRDGGAYGVVGGMGEASTC